MLHCFYSQTIIVNQYNTFRLDMNEKKMKKDVKKMSKKSYCISEGSLYKLRCLKAWLRIRLTLFQEHKEI